MAAVFGVVAGTAVVIDPRPEDALTQLVQQPVAAEQTATPSPEPTPDASGSPSVSPSESASPAEPAATPDASRRSSRNSVSRSTSTPATTSDGGIAVGAAPASGGTAGQVATVEGDGEGSTASAAATSSAARGSTTTESAAPAPTRSSTSAQASSQSGGRAAVGGSLSSQRSGLAWASGVHLDHTTPATLQEFENWRGRPLDVAMIWLPQGSWSDIEDPSADLGMWRGQSWQMVISVAMLPDSGGDLASCAAGAYNQHWVGLGRALDDAGLGDSVIRLGWEFDGNWYRWSAAGQPENYAGCYRQAVDSVRQNAPNTKWDFSASRGPTHDGGLSDPLSAYPGDDYVDIIGVSNYDWWMAATDRAAWDRYHMSAAEEGLQLYIDFARAHGKKFALAEWGNRTGGSEPSVGNDNPTYVGFIHQLLSENPGIVAYESLFQAYGGEYNNGASLPNAAAAYRSAFGGG